MSNLFVISRQVKVLLSFILLFSVINAKLRTESILNEQMFSLDLKCSIPMLGVSLQEFQIDKKGMVISVFEVKKNFEALGVEDNDQTNPQRIKSMDLVYLQEPSKIGVFWSNKDDQILVSKPDNRFTEILTPCAIWIKDIIKITQAFTSAKPSELVKDEAKFGNKKFAFENTAEKVRYEYIFQDDQLKAITQIRPGGDLMSNLIVFVNSYKILKKDEFSQIPPGVQFDDAQN
jgi:hypothetical protein